MDGIGAASLSDCRFPTSRPPFANGQEANERGINEFLDQASTALQGDNMGVKHAAANCVLRFADLGEEYEKVARMALRGVFDV